jgi:S-adenosylmethionine decarboxylase
VGAPSTARFGSNTLGRLGVKTAQRKLGLAAIVGGRALKSLVTTKTVTIPLDAHADHFITRDGVTFAGSHLIVDFWEAEGLDNKDRIEQAMRDAVDAAGATLLHIHLQFTPSGGISGVAVLAESHISVHTWPERGYAAFDVFMCGDAEPRKALKALERDLAPKRVIVGMHKRGVV